MHPLTTGAIASQNANLGSAVGNAQRDQARSESIINRQHGLSQELDLTIERVAALRDKINGGQPTVEGKNGLNAPRCMPNGFLASLDDTQEMHATKLQILSSILNDIERNF